MFQANMSCCCSPALIIFMIVASSSNRTFWRSALCACENPSCLLYCKMLFPTSQSVFLLMQHLSQGTCLFSCHIFWKKNEGNLFLALLARYGVVFLCPFCPCLPFSSHSLGIFRRRFSNFIQRSCRRHPTHQRHQTRRYSASFLQTCHA